MAAMHSFGAIWYLAHWGSDTAANILQMKFWMCFFTENYSILIQISLNVVPNDLIDNEPLLIQVMARHQTGTKPLPESMIIHFNDTYMIYMAMVG